jgi:hypothetical protein
MNNKIVPGCQAVTPRYIQCMTNCRGQAPVHCHESGAPSAPNSTRPNSSTTVQNDSTEAQQCPTCSGCQRLHMHTSCSVYWGMRQRQPTLPSCCRSMPTPPHCPGSPKPQLHPGHASGINAGNSRRSRDAPHPWRTCRPLRRK